MLIFCASRAACQTTASMVAEGLRAGLGPVNPDTAAARSTLIAELTTAMGGYRNELLEGLMGACNAKQHLTA